MSWQFVLEYQEAVFRLDLSGEVPMSIPELLAILELRGLKLVLAESGPVVRGDREQVTPALKDCLKIHKPEILEYLRKQQEETPVA
jgi:hypothetical protein